MNTNWQETLSIASPVIALISVFFVRRSSQAARKSLDLARRTGQAAYEAAKTGHSPAVNLFLTKIEYRHPKARDPKSLIGMEAEKWATEYEKDSLEVVIEGQLINTRPHEILLTCRDHENSGRSVRYPYRNQSVFILGGREVELGHTILPPGREVSFMWVDRRSREEWIAVYNLHHRNTWGDPEREIPRLTPFEAIKAAIRREPLTWARERKVKRSGFRIVCESRMTQRMATVWEAEVIQPPIQVTGRDENGVITFEARTESLRGPLDDRVVHYRVDLDSTLALVVPPKRRWLVGRI
ncbi:hypothetical protein ACFU7T_21690 [Streptomyces sp. NPDC057555]|uniref:hypothetical protein n=1 Tax=Streptomyces sp. NPDC057555 TaxID=3346166 RepID=UPI0036782B0C